MSDREGQRKEDKKPSPSTPPNLEIHPKTQDHDLSQSLGA